MEQIKSILEASLLWRAFLSLCVWFGKQWRESALVSWFLHPPVWERAATQSSLLYRLWSSLWSVLQQLYAALRLDKLFSGSIFLQSALWCALPLLLAPMLPTMAVLGLVIIGYCSVALRLIHEKQTSLTFSPINKYLLLYVGVYLVAALMSVTPSGSLQPTLLIIFFTLVPFAIENTFTTRRSLEGLTAGFVLTGTVVAFIGIGQYIFGITGTDSWVDSDMFSSITTRVYSTLQNPNVLSEYLLLVLPFAMALCLSRKDWTNRIFWAGCFGVMALCLILTFSRGGWLGFLIAAALFVLLLEPRLMVLAPFALIALYFVMPDTVINRLTSVGDLRDTSTSYRFSIWMGSLAMLKDYWMCGVGPGTAAFNLVYPAYSYNAANAQHAHNLYLQLIIDGGICVLLLFLVLLFVLYRRVCATLKQGTASGCHFHLIAVLASLVGFLAQSMTDHSFYNYRVILVFWTIVGLGASWVSLCEKEVDSCAP